LNDGELLDLGTPEQTKNSNDPVVAKFISGGL